MALNPSAPFLAKNELQNKTPIYLVDFVVDPVLDTHVKYCTYVPENPIAPTALPYISFISGGDYSITPDEGSASSAQLSIELQDNNDSVTAMLAAATGNLQKKNCSVKAGYLGMDEADMLNVFFGEVTSYKYTKDGSWTITASDTVRALNKYVFTDAADGLLEIELTGNPISLLLALLMSIRGDQTNGPYDIIDPGVDRQPVGIGIDYQKIDIETFEFIRNTYYPSTSTIFNFKISERMKANDFFKNEFYKPLNMYPVVRGDGKYSAAIYSPPLPPYDPITLTERDMLDIPDYDGNLKALINEVSFSYDIDAGGTYAEIAVYADGPSITERGVGDRTLEVKSRGLKESYTDAEGFVTRSSNRIFARYATPPIKLSVTTTFDKLLIEAGDTILVSNKFIPNLETGLFDFSDVPMEVLKRSVDWKRGVVRMQLLQTGFQNKKFASISPSYIVASGISTTQFTVNEPKDWSVGFHGTMYQWDKADRKFRLKDTNVTVTDINTITNTITTSTMSVIPDTDWRFVFSDYTTQTDDQKAWASIVDADPYYIIP